MRPRQVIPFMSVLLALLAPCTQAAAEFPLDVLSRAAGVRSAEFVDTDVLAALVAQRVPGYAGMLRREDGRIEVLLTEYSGLFAAGKADPGWQRSPAAAARLAQDLGASNLRRVEHDAASLLRWKGYARTAWQTGVMHGLDIDEASNRIVVLVDPRSSDTDRQALHQALMREGIPPQALALVPAPRQGAYQQVGVSLGFQVPPLAAGAKFRVQPAPQAAALGACTIGAALQRNGVAGFLVASHCTAAAFAPDPDSARFFVTSAAGERIMFGSEGGDPPAWKCVGLGLQVQSALCRWADASFVAADKAAFAALGRILMAPRDAPDDPSGVAFATASGSVPVTGTADWLPVGSSVSKTGIITGTSKGLVTRTCVDFLIEGTSPPRVLLCQSQAQLYAKHGDSGSPIFLGPTPSSPGATLAGLLVGGPSVEPSTEGEASSMVITFSPWRGVAADLGGNLRVAAP